MNIIADTCFWISLCDSQDDHHEEVVSMMELLKSSGKFHILVPHPVLYETLRSKMVRKPMLVKVLIKYFKDTVKIPDVEYVENAYNLIAAQAENCQGNASMVDFAIMLMAEDSKNRIGGILTNNGRDFASFCQIKKIHMLDSLDKLRTC